jgi:hypothetical protein
LLFDVTAHLGPILYFKNTKMVENRLIWCRSYEFYDFEQKVFGQFFYLLILDEFS